MPAPIAEQAKIKPSFVIITFVLIHYNGFKYEKAGHVTKLFKPVLLTPINIIGEIATMFVLVRLSTASTRYSMILRNVPGTSLGSALRMARFAANAKIVMTNKQGMLPNCLSRYC